MATVVILPSVLGVRQGVLDAAERIRAAGHEARIVDLYGGRIFDEYGPALAYAEEELGHEVLMQRSLDGVADLPDGFVPLGFSLGCVMVVHLATSRAVSGAVMIAGALPASAFGDGRSWPAGIDAQTHAMLEDPWREPDMIAAASAELAAGGAVLEVLDYPGTGHLFTDASLPDEYDEAATELLWSRVLPFVHARD